MALIKKIDSGAGYTIEYWHILTFEVKVKAKQVVAVIAGYVNKQARIDGLRPVQNKTLSIPTDQLDLNGNLRQQIYEWALAQKEPVKEDAEKKMPSFGLLRNNNNTFFAGATSDK